MIQQIKIPEGYDPQGLASQMAQLAIDPAFTALAKIIECNDMARLRNELENVDTAESKIKELQYRISVLKEFAQLPKNLFESISRGLQGKEEIEDRDDPYSTSKDISESR